MDEIRGIDPMVYHGGKVVVYQARYFYSGAPTERVIATRETFEDAELEVQAYIARMAAGLDEIRIDNQVDERTRWRLSGMLLFGTYPPTGAPHVYFAYIQPIFDEDS